MLDIDKSEFIHFEERASGHPLVERVWRCHSDRADGFLSVAANSFEMAITRLGGKSFLTLRGPETAATVVDCPAEGQWVGIRCKSGTFMWRFLPGSLRDHNDVTLPHATGHSFWLNGSAVEYPSFGNAETFVERLAKSGMLSRDPIVEDALLRRPGERSLRSLQRRFLGSTGVTYATFRQIERARYATILLREGVSILDVVSRLRYFDQAHLTRSLKRFIGETPVKIILRQKQLSFLYKGATLLACTLLYVIPRTSTLGAMLLTAYLGGAAASNIRAGMPLFNVLFPMIIAGLVWGGLWFRDLRVREL